MYKLNLEKSRELHNLVKDKAKINNCYLNVFYLLDALEEKENYKICYGYADTNNMLFRHCFLKDNADNKIIDITSIMYKKSEIDGYYIFKEFDFEEYIDLVLDVDRTATFKYLYKEELELLEKLNKENKCLNAIDLAFLKKTDDELENIKLLKLAEKRSNSNTSNLEDVIKEEGFSMEELEALSEDIEFE